MPNVICVPQTAGGASIVSPNNALLNDAVYSRIPKTITPTLALTNLTDRTLGGTRDIVGFELSIDAWAETLVGQMGRAARIASGNIDQMVELAPNAHDGSLVTYYGDASPGSATDYTVIHDLGTPQSVGHVKMTFLYGNDILLGGVPTFEYSDDGFSWAGAFRTGLSISTNPDTVETDNYDITPVTARYWRLTHSDANQLRLYNFRLYAADTTTERLPINQTDSRRVEFAITKDGSSAAGTWQQVSLGDGQATYLVGGPTNLLGATVSQAELAASTFGVLIRRSTQGGENSTTWRAVEFAQLTVYHNPSGGSFMPDRVTEVQLSILGKEASRGALSASINQKLKATPIMVQLVVESKVLTFQGDRADGDHVVIAESSEATMEGDPTFDELGIHLASLIGKPSTTALGSGAYRHEFILNTQALSDPQTYTYEYGDANVAERVQYLIMAAMNLTVNRKENRVSGRYLGQRIEDRTLITAGRNEVQTLTLGTATGYTLRFGGQVTSGLTNSSNSAAIQAALVALTSVGAGGFVVSGAGPFTITAGAALAGKPLPLIEVASFSGGTTPTLARTTTGGYIEFPIEPIAPSMWSLYWDTTFAGLGGTKLTALFEADVNVENVQAPYWVIDGAKTSWAAVVEAPMRVTSRILVQADQAAQAMVTDFRNRTQKFARLQAVGPVIGGGFSHTFQIDLATKLESYGPWRDADGMIVAREFGLYGRYDPAWGAAAKFVLINTVTSY